MRKKVVILGNNFGGLTAAFSLKHELKGDVDITVVSDRDYFLYNPSLIWLPFGKRADKDITFKVGPTFEKGGINFVQSAATDIDPLTQTVRTADGGNLSYDYLIVATGTRNKEDVVEGFRENSSTITTLESAIKSGEAWKRFLDKPGDVVIGATQGASCFGAAYEYLFNVSYQLRKAGLHNKVKLHYITSEPYLGHFGIDGMPMGEGMVKMFMKMEGIKGHVGKAIDYIDEGAVMTTEGDKLPFAYSMIVPPFVGQDFLKKTEGLTNETGFVLVKDTYQSQKYDNIYSIGLAAAVKAPYTTPLPVGVPKTGFPTEQQAHTAAKNIADQIRGKQPEHEKPFGKIPAVCVMDAGNNGILLLGDHMLKPRKAAILIPGPQNHAMKIGLEKYFLWKMKNGKSQLP